MTSPYQTGDLDRIFSEAAESRPAGNRRLIVRATLVFVALIVVATAVVYWVVRQREHQVIDELAQRTEILASTRAEVLKTRLDSLGSAGFRLSRSDVFRLFATEAGLNGAVSPGELSLAAQIPYMMQAVTQLARQEELVGVYLVDAKGRAIISSAGAPELSPDQRRSATAVFTGKKRALAPARQYANGLSLDVLLPVAPPQEENPAAPTVVSGVFVLTTAVHTTLADMIGKSPLARESETTRLFQVGASEVQELVPDGRPVLETMAGEPFAPGRSLPFGRRAAIGGGASVFSFGAWVPGVPWIVVQEADAAAGLAALRSYAWGVSTVAGLVTLCIVSAFIAFWWHQASEHNKALATQYRDLGTQIAAQRRFLSSLMNTLTEMIGLKKKNGTYAYVNPSFANVIGRAPHDIEGLNDAEIFGRSTAERLHHSDQRALSSDKPVVVEEIVHLSDGAHYFQMSKVPYREESGEVEGILVLARDVTEIREAEQRRQRGLQAMTRAFVRVIEQVDPYLSGHSHNVRDIGVAIAKILDLPQDDITTIDIAAMLAQIGKLSIPREIVSKAERLTPAEMKVMQGHVSQAISILRDVEFGLPVVDAIAQMYERLDGSGYPANRAGDHICLSARILAVADVFAARIELRSYRQKISPEEALSVILDHPERYDATVVAALEKFVRSIEGEKLMTRIQGS